MTGRRNKNTDKLFAGFFALLFIMLFFLPASIPAYGGEDQFAFLSEPGVRIGVSNGSVQEQLVRKLYPGAEIYIMEKFSGYEALAQGKIDAYVYDRKQMELALENGLKGVRLLDGSIGDPTRIAIGISDRSDIPDIEDKVNSFIDEIKADGTLDDMYDRWVVEGDHEMPETKKPLSPEYTLTVGTTGDVEPYSFYEGNNLVGYDMELVNRFAAYINADISVKIFDWDSIVASCKSGKTDIIASDLQYTPERAEEIIFSQVLFEEQNGVMVKDTGLAAGNGISGFISSVKSSFIKTFVKEDRYTLFLSGIFTTLLITVLSVLFGTILGFLVFMACRGGGRMANFLADRSVRLVLGMPTVVLLMILYYVVFSWVDISGTIVAVIAFSLIFASGVLNMLRIAVGAVDSGQTEAALALGYSDISSFFRFILPQAMPYFLPVYRNELVSLIKATAVVGYIAVQDLTKMGDIVRSRTYEAFFPLIAVAVIYFFLEWLITLTASKLENGFDPKRRKKEEILKGITITD